MAAKRGRNLGGLTTDRLKQLFTLAPHPIQIMTHPAPPHEEDDRIDEQLQKRRRDDTALRGR